MNNIEFASIEHFLHIDEIIRYAEAFAQNPVPSKVLYRRRTGFPRRRFAGYNLHGCRPFYRNR